jgi:CubicO group peptidase (beta-lactamase class C family)
MAKIGNLVMSKGRHSSQQLVPAAWIEAATSRQIDIPSTLAPGSAYGRFWWLGQTGNKQWIGAFGNGGQRIWILPARKLLVVTTMGLYDSPRQGEIPKEILAAALNATATGR